MFLNKTGCFLCILSQIIRPYFICKLTGPLSHKLFLFILSLVDFYCVITLRIPSRSDSFMGGLAKKPCRLQSGCTVLCYARYLHNTHWFPIECSTDDACTVFFSIIEWNEAVQKSFEHEVISLICKDTSV
jgi:hypothetical protein